MQLGDGAVVSGDNEVDFMSHVSLRKVRLPQDVDGGEHVAWPGGGQDQSSSDHELG